MPARRRPGRNASLSPDVRLFRVGEGEHRIVARLQARARLDLVSRACHHGDLSGVCGTLSRGPSPGDRSDEDHKVRSPRSVINGQPIPHTCPWCGGNFFKKTIAKES